MKKLLCIAVAVAFVLGMGGLANAKPKAEKGEKAAKVAKADKKPKKSAEERFKALDKDGDGKLSKEEFVGKKEGEQKEKAEKLFSKKDKDGDGSLSLEEFTPKKRRTASRRRLQKPLNNSCSFNECRGRRADVRRPFSLPDSVPMFAAGRPSPDVPK